MALRYPYLFGRRDAAAQGLKLLLIIDTTSSSLGWQQSIIHSKTYLQIKVKNLYFSPPLLNHFILIYNACVDTTEFHRRSRWGTLGFLIILLVILLTWLFYTPPGLDGKIHALGYSVCHQLETHSISIGGNFLPLCARCTGTFLGLLFSITYLLTRGRVSGFPAKPKLAILFLFAILFAFDGINSTLSTFTRVQPLYPPSNILRLSTGFLFGTALANLIVPLWNQTLWTVSIPKPVLEKWSQLAIMLLINLLCGALILVDIRVLYYPIAILSTFSILLVLSMIYTLLWCIILKKENRMHRFGDGIRIYIAGMMTAIIQIGLMDLIRYWLTGTWNSL